MSKVIRARYEKGVLRPLDKLELREGEEVLVFIRRRSIQEVLDKYAGILGEATVEELRRLEEEAQAQ